MATSLTELRTLPVAAEAVPDADILLAAIDDPLIVVETDGDLLPANEPAQSLVDRYADADPSPLAEILTKNAGRVAASAKATSEVVMLADTGCIKVVTWPMPDGRALCLVRDASVEMSLRNVLVSSRQRYKDLVEAVADFVWECDPAGSFVHISHHGGMGYDADDLIGRDPDKFVASRSAARWPATATEPVHGLDVWVTGAAGKDICLTLDAVPFDDGVDGRRGVRGIARDVTEVRMRDQQLARAQTRERMVSSILQAMRTEWRPIDMLRAAAGTIRREFGALACAIYRPDQDPADDAPLVAAGTPLEPQRTRRLRRALATDALVMHDTSIACPALGMALQCRGRRMGVLVVWRAADRPAWSDSDLSMLHALEVQIGTVLQQLADFERLAELSRTDELTGLLNRRAFTDDITSAMARARRVSQPAALLYVDLDNFKLLNDMHGHDAGDNALREVAAVLTRAVRPYDIAARIGGDEFALWLEDIEPAAAARRARRLLGDLRRWAMLQPGTSRPLGASIGVAVFDPKAEEPAAAFIDRADRAMYRAKQAGRNRISIARAPKAPADKAAKAAGDTRAKKA